VGDNVILINIGVFTIVPSDATRQILKIWREDMKKRGEAGLNIAVDQSLLQDMLRTSTSSFDPQTRRFSLRLHPRVGVQRPIIMGFFSGIDVPHVGHVKWLLPQITAGSLNWQPYLLHLAWLDKLGAKAEFLTAVGIDLVAQDLKCKTTVRLNSGFNWTNVFCTALEPRLVDRPHRPILRRMPCPANH
jgi:hypothetical protein